ncbi:unnamed protein product, partial [Mesorhabditis spiculigera]
MAATFKKTLGTFKDYKRRKEDVNAKLALGYLLKTLSSVAFRIFKRNSIRLTRLTSHMDLISSGRRRES